jgi:hypothetical protein
MLRILIMLGHQSRRCADRTGKCESKKKFFHVVL